MLALDSCQSGTMQDRQRQNQHPVCSTSTAQAVQHTCFGGKSLLFFTFIIIRLLQGRLPGLASISCLASFCRSSQSVNTRSLGLHSSMSSFRGLEQLKGVRCSAVGICCLILSSARQSGNKVRLLSAKEPLKHNSHKMTWIY